MAQLTAEEWEQIAKTVTACLSLSLSRDSKQQAAELQKLVPSATDRQQISDALTEITLARAINNRNSQETIEKAFATLQVMIQDVLAKYTAAKKLNRPQYGQLEQAIISSTSLNIEHLDLSILLMNVTGQKFSSPIAHVLHDDLCTLEKKVRAMINTLIKRLSRKGKQLIFGLNTQLSKEEIKRTLDNRDVNVAALYSSRNYDRLIGTLEGQDKVLASAWWDLRKILRLVISTRVDVVNSSGIWTSTHYYMAFTLIALLLMSCLAIFYLLNLSHVEQGTISVGFLALLFFYKQWKKQHRPDTVLPLDNNALPTATHYSDSLLIAHPTIASYFFEQIHASKKKAELVQSEAGPAEAVDKYIPAPSWWEPPAPYIFKNRTQEKKDRPVLENFLRFIPAQPELYDLTITSAENNLAFILTFQLQNNRTTPRVITRDLCVNKADIDYYFGFFTNENLQHKGGSKDFLHVKLPTHLCLVPATLLQQIPRDLYTIIENILIRGQYYQQGHGNCITNIAATDKALSILYPQGYRYKLHYVGAHGNSRILGKEITCEIKVNKLNAFTTKYLNTIKVIWFDQYIADAH
jgi:hypothetical protein